MSEIKMGPIAETAAAQRAGTSFSWRRELLFLLLIGLTIAASHLFIGWYNGRGIRPLALAGIMLWITTMFALGIRRRWVKARRPELRLDSGGFSLVELLVLFTGLTLFIGFSAADYQESRRYYREQKTLRSSAATLLGPDGRIDFEVDGSLTISVCDRSFDDNRLAKLGALIDDWKQDVGVSRLGFGTGATTGGTPPAWRGVTDGSVALSCSGMNWNGCLCMGRRLARMDARDCWRCRG